MAKLVKGNISKATEKTAEIREQPFVLPESKEGEQKEDYVAILKSDSPAEYLTLGGLSFHRSTQPAIVGTRTYQEQNGGRYEETLITLPFTESQIKALREAASKRFLKIRGESALLARYIAEYTKQPDGWGKTLEIPFDKLIILVKASEYAPVGAKDLTMSSFYGATNDSGKPSTSNKKENK